MKKVIKLVGLLLSLVLVTGCAYLNDYTNQSAQVKQDFIDRIAKDVVEVNQNTTILNSFVIAQAALESNYGRSELAENYHNLFGVKAGSQSKNKVTLPTQEYVNGEYKTYNLDFQVYQSDKEAIQAHQKLLLYGTTWNSSQYERVLKSKNYKEASVALQKSGYATDPEYADKIISVIEAYSLYNYD
ncbi:glucosaminidase domain-containing protein [Holzapfeliella sp. He02]|uniref:Glucosaminidase domain-containing protein n=1 Tax=Holzapfeliella saturejae TaxID=3082953 RepID=A0ABU8SJA4_9LACO